MEAASQLITAIAALVSAVFWPIVIVTVFIVFRRELRSSFNRLPDLLGRVRRLKIAGIEAELDKVADAVPPADDLGEQITPQEIQTASRVETQARSLDDDTLWDQVHALSTEYESLRKVMPAGPARTQAMTRVFVKMRTLGPSVVSFVDALERSRSAGERLFAVAIMQIEPDVADIDWLEKRFRSERPFLFFHAANALRVVAHAPDPQRSALARAAAARALEKVTGFGLGPDRDTVRVLKSIVDS